MRLYYLFASFFLILLSTTFNTAQSNVEWWITNTNQKLTTPLTITDGQSLQLHAAQAEYAPFQIVIRGTPNTAFTVPIIDLPAEHFELNLYEQVFFPLLIIPSPEIFSLARLTQAETVADGLYPINMGSTITIPETGVTAIWVDLFVKAGTPPTEYQFTTTTPDHGNQQSLITVYPIMLPETGAMNIIIPLEAGWTMYHYAGEQDPEAFQRDVNRLMIEHYLIPGSLSGSPRLTEQGWNFSEFDAEIDALPLGSKFYTPIPYSEIDEYYYILDPQGQPYTQTNFDDPQFVEAINMFFRDLADYLNAKGRLADALVYPVDESRWVADEPDHNGPQGYEHLAKWTQIIRSYGLHVSASRVSPATYAPGWLESSQVTDDVHVHVDLFDAAPQLYAEWDASPNQSTSWYLNEYGDLIDMPASIQRGLMWHAYGYNVRILAGYSAMEWVDERYGLRDPWVEPTAISPESGYGGGALIWPGPLPSVRLKLLREGVEDSRLLDLYAAQQGPLQAHYLASCITPGPLADQNPPHDLFDSVHTALLAVVSTDTLIDVAQYCLPSTQFSQVGPMPALSNLSGWEFLNAQATQLDDGLQINFESGEAGASYWLGGENWQGWAALQVDIENTSSYFAEVDIAIGDEENYLLLKNGALTIGPNTKLTFTLPLVVPFGETEIDMFNWSNVRYLELAINTIIERKDGFNEIHTYDIGGRTLIFSNFRFAK